MESTDVYKDIAERTNGDVYVGVVGPVRTGKSTFIKRFMDLLVIPNIENPYDKERAKDELPQSAGGRTIMTTEPKFVPSEAVEITAGGNVNFRTRLIDCVGYLVPGAVGHLDGAEPRMVSTPWSDEKVPFAEAAETGTRKVINDHSTIGVVITTDGTISDIPREDYIDAETRVVNELKAISKPFVMVLNTTKPYAPETEALKRTLIEKHGAPVTAMNCAQLKEDDIDTIMESALYEFPVSEVRINLPKWLETLPPSHWLKSDIIDAVKQAAKGMGKLRDVNTEISSLEENEYIKKAFVDKILLGEGAANVEASLDDSLFYKVLSEMTGVEIAGEHQLISTMRLLAECKHEYDKIKFALEEVKQKGYGIVTPVPDEMRLDEPKLVKHGARYGVKIKASAPSIHLVRADIETEISPIVGTQKQSEDLLDYLNTEMRENPSNIWSLNVFGKTMHEMVKDGLQTKLYRMPDDAQLKMQEALQKIINEGGGGMVCILL
ncbi:MAG: stage IV sporulation protein A [Clostridiales bacterium]|jgi:stage IV sporulation protein A|nr:stage IV sporulation protein A [Clostridiales bacterium]